MSSYLAQLHKFSGLVVRKLLPSPRRLLGEGLSSWDSCQQTCTNNYLSTALNQRVALDQLKVRAHETQKSPYARLMPLLGIVVGSQAAKGTKIRVVDFGGGAGLHWWEAKCTFGDIFDWVVVETSSLVDSVTRVGIGQPRFARSLAEASDFFDRVDLCLASGSLQYCPQPKRELDGLIGLNPRHLMLLRTPILTAGQEGGVVGKYWVQSSKVIHHVSYPTLSPAMLSTARYPVSFLTQKDLVSIDRAYRRIFEFSEGPMYRTARPSIAVCGHTILWQQD